jgi:hypothetical protein
MRTVHMSPRFKAPEDLRFICPRCSYQRSFGTVAGWRSDVVAHLLQHQIRLVFDESEQIGDLRELA